MMKKFRILFLLLGLWAATAVNVYAQQTNVKPSFLDEGDKVDSYPQVDWLKGQPLSKLDPGTIYIVELWATWCVPCIAAMPHLAELHHKFKDKNVVFIAQDVMEDDKAKVEAFVSKKADLLSFPVAYCKKGSEFEMKWVKGAGVSSIPQTFVIQNNTLLWITRPNMLNEAVLQLLVDKKFTVEAAEKLAKKD